MNKKKEQYRLTNIYLFSNTSLISIQKNKRKILFAILNNNNNHHHHYHVPNHWKKNKKKCKLQKQHDKKYFDVFKSLKS